MSLENLSTQFAAHSTQVLALADDVKGVKTDVAAIKAEIVKIVDKQTALAVMGPGADSAQRNLEEVAAVSAFARTGDQSGIKALSIGSDPDGGYTVIPQFESEIRSILRDVTPLRALANVTPVSTSVLELLVDPSLAPAQWVGETQSRSETGGPQLVKVSIPVNELFAMPKATQSLIDDSAVDIAAWLQGSIASSFAITEGQSFTSGNGVGQPFGFLAYATDSADDFTRTWAKIQYVPSGSATTITADSIIALSMKLRVPYRPNATWLMSRSTATVVKQMKDGQGRYLWGDLGLNEGVPPTLCGFPVAYSEDMPAIAANSFPLALADWKQGYTIADRLGIRLVRDNVTQKPYVLFYTTKRVGGGVVDFNAIKLLKVATS